MKVKDLPQADLNKLRSFMPTDTEWDVISDLEVHELPAWIGAILEDLDARIARKRRLKELYLEAERLMDAISSKNPELTPRTIVPLLREPDQRRFWQIIQELDQITKVSLVTRDRQPWHGAVEEEILSRLHPGGTNVDEVVATVLRRNPTYPPGPVRRYAAYLLETSAGLR
ncbi:MAG TPA: hypothetical protein VEX68_00605 [Bryobacteraceae bacterium]|nr:hypothetical protein [Bryobacteraceae bacterium]